jgi:hypothetical protein
VSPAGSLDDERGECARLAGPGHAGHEHDTPLRSDVALPEFAAFYAAYRSDGTAGLRMS